MPKFVTIGYGDQAGYDRTSAKVRAAAHEHDSQLQKAGVVMGRAGEPVQVRNTDAAGVRTMAGSFMTSSLPVAGFAVVEADTIDDAIKAVSGTPCAVAHGVVEVWPLTE